ncbi:phage portal protein [Nocardioides piscis]|uniref:Phage portal protein n=1 Tax=Nocardioides piscis TaxID=2714938 RepID=A0A6G7YBG9_9ACTN|nr:phage portal protein [Nocardioides piscis]QIK74110.1 phage portal protein [Nocardioides piscis]
MGAVWDWVIGRPSPVIEAAITGHGPAFAVDPAAIPAQIFGLESYADPIAPAPRISRREAIQCPAVKRARDLITTLGTLPLSAFDTQRVEHVNDLLAQPERNRPRSKTMIDTLDDLLFEGVAYWLVVERAFDGYPRFIQRVHPDNVDVDADDATVRVNDRLVPATDVIQFESPNDALLVAGARAIRTCLRLDATASMYADEPMPTGYFSSTEGADPADDDDVVNLLNAWKAARKARATAYVPAALTYNVTQFTPEQLELANARQHAVLEIARAAGVDPEELGVSTTSRTYANQFDRRKAFVDFTLGAYRQVIEDRLSMRDVTRRGYFVRFNLDSFLRSDPKTRMETYVLGLQVGAYDRAEIRDLEDKPALPAPLHEAPVTASAETFNEPEIAVRMDATSSAQFSVDVEARTIRGLAVPYGRSATSGGRKWQFAKGVLQFADVSRVKLLANHDWKQAIGKAIALDDTEEGLVATFKVARGAAGDNALALAEDGVWDGLSIGLGDPSLIRFTERNGIAVATSAPLAEISLTPCPAFADARVTSVAATSDFTKQEQEMPDSHTSGTGPQPVALAAVTDAIKSGFAALAEGPTLVAPQVLRSHVYEGPMYRFDGAPGKHDFSTDVIASLKDGDREAGARVQSFIEEAFAPKFEVDTGNVTSLNPQRQRPDMYVDKLDYSTPVYDALHKGTLADITPFVFPKFGSSSGLVGPHTEGVEPTPGAFTATSQTVNPSAVSGKVEITREVWDQGGNPQVSGLIWREMVRAYYESLEASAVALLDAASPTQVALTAGAQDDALVNEFEAEIAALQFIRGGNRFTFMPTHIDLYTALAGAVDAGGRKLLPIIGPQNANGTSAPHFASLNIAGVRASPSWALGVSGVVSESSYLVNPADVHVWNTAPSRLQFEYRVAYVDLAIWGYVASAISRLDGVRAITYTAAA